ncbi:cadherin repeat domain-containing protein, partial [Sphingomicrobium lutaoense]
MTKLSAVSALTIAFLSIEPAFAQNTTLNADFQSGAIAEYSGNNSNRTSNAVLFDGLNSAFGSTNVSSINISQSTDDGNWGGSGNNTAVTATIHFVDGSSITFQASLEWVRNAGGGGYDWIGVTSQANQDDGYKVSDPALKKTYVLQFPQSSLDLSSLLPDGVDGSQNSGATLSALNQYFPGPGSSSLTFTSSNTFSYAENSGDTNAIGTVQTANATGAVRYAIVSGNSQGWYEIDPASGVLSLTPTGVAAAIPNDFETSPNSRSITVEADDGSGVVAQTITLTETDVLEVGLITFTSGGSFDYAENSAETDVLATVAATGGAAPLTYSIIAGNADGWYAIDPATGEIRLTAAGVAAAANDFETAPNAHVLTVQASD